MLIEGIVENLKKTYHVETINETTTIGCAVNSIESSWQNLQNIHNSITNVGYTKRTRLSRRCYW